jgi:hypothetical protein
MRRTGMCLLLVATGAVVLAGCGSPGTEAPPTTPAAGADGASATEPTAIVPDATVTAGLADVRVHATKVKEALAGAGPDAAKAHAREMYDAWYSFEATVRQNEKALYLQIEDGLADIQAGARDGRADRVDRGAKAVEEGAAAYLGRHP